MKCKSCGFQIEQGYTFCGHCGTAVGEVVQSGQGGWESQETQEWEVRKEGSIRG